MPTGDDHTAVTAPPAAWDGEPREGDEDSVAEAPRITAATAVIQPAEYELSPGAKLGEYQIESKLGQGGMGVVFAAVHPLIGKRAAIKILKRELCADPQTVERFIDEARVVNQIGHPNIVDIFAFGEMPDGRSYFVMEYLKGDTLRARIAAGRMELPEMARLVRQLARALQAAHDKGVIHRDLKPDNIFLVEMKDEPTTVKLLDFGIAKLARNDHRIEKTATGAIVGTPQYIAPEQAKGYTIDHRADIYALGGIIFEMLTGRPPFVADNAMEIVAKHLMETPVRVSTIAPDVSPELDELVDQMLSKQPDKRPSLAKVVEVIDAARGRASSQAIEDRSVQIVAAPISMPAFDTPSVKPSRPPWIAIAGVPIAALVAFLIVRALGSSSDEPAKPVAKPEPPAKVAVVTPPPKKVEPPPQPPKIAVKVDPPKVNVPPVAPPVARTARLRLTIVNGGPGTDIRIDGALAAADTQLTYGTHNVEIRSKGMAPQRFTVEIGTGGTAKRIVLEPKEPKVRPKQPKQPVQSPDPDDDKSLMRPGTLKSK